MPNSNVSLDVIKDEVTRLLVSFGHDTVESEKAMAAFLGELRSDIADALIAGDQRTLNYLRDAIAGRTGRISLDLTFKEQQAIQNTVVTVVSVLIKVGIAALI